MIDYYDLSDDRLADHFTLMFNVMLSRGMLGPYEKQMRSATAYVKRAATDKTEQK